jgi:hypothetical protein
LSAARPPSWLASRSNPHPIALAAEPVPHFPRPRALALFGRPPPQCEAPLVIAGGFRTTAPVLVAASPMGPSSETLHMGSFRGGVRSTSGVPETAVDLLHCQSRKVGHISGRQTRSAPSVIMLPEGAEVILCDVSECLCGPNALFYTIGVRRFANAKRC